jgi:hypothetical protein
MPEEQMPKALRISIVVDYPDGTMQRVQIERPESLAFQITQDGGPLDEAEEFCMDPPADIFTMEPPYGFRVSVEGDLDTQITIWYPDMG